MKIEVYKNGQPPPESIIELRTSFESTIRLQNGKLDDSGSIFNACVAELMKMGVDGEQAPDFYHPIIFVPDF